MSQHQAGAVQEVSLMSLQNVNTDFSKFLSPKIRRWCEFGFEMSSGMFVHVEFCHTI
jgi:hypothetical protein